MDSLPAELVDRVRRRLREDGIDPARDAAGAHHAVAAEVRRHSDLALARGMAPVDDEPRVMRALLASMSGWGPLDPYLSDPTVEELWINAPDPVFQGPRSFLENEKTLLAMRVASGTGASVGTEPHGGSTRPPV